MDALVFLPWINLFLLAISTILLVIRSVSDYSRKPNTHKYFVTSQINIRVRGGDEIRTVTFNEREIDYIDQIDTLQSRILRLEIENEAIRSSTFNSKLFLYLMSPLLVVVKLIFQLKSLFSKNSKSNK